MKKEHLAGFSKEHLHDIKYGEGLEVGAVHPAHHDGYPLSGLGNSDGASDAPSGESNHETQRHGSRPKPEKAVNKPKEVTGLSQAAKAKMEKARKGDGAEKMNVV